MHHGRQFSRRLLLGGLGAGAAGLAAPHGALASAPAADRRWSSAHSANGWRIGGPTRTHRVEGSPLDLTLADAPAATLLLHAARRINYELDTLRKGDLVGLAHDRQTASAARSNLLSGTAIHFRPGAYPLGTDDNLFADEIVVIEDIVAEAGGELGWGGHLSVPDQGLFFLTSAPGTASATKVARGVQERDSIDSSDGAGAIDAFEPSRRRAAKAFADGRR